MKSFMKVAVLALASVSSIALANHHENCEVKGKKIHVKDKAACEKKKGTFMEAAPAAEATKAPEAAPAPEAAKAPEGHEAPKK